MKINFKQPRYVIPLVVLPFLCLFFYVYAGSLSSKKGGETPQSGVNAEIGDVSEEVRKRELADKLDAFRDRYKASDGYSGINPISEELAKDSVLQSDYSDAEKRKSDAIEASLRARIDSNNLAPAGSGYAAIPQRAKQKIITPVSGWRQRIGESSGLSQQDRAMAKALSDLAASRKQLEQDEPKDHGIKPDESPDPMELFRKQMSYLYSTAKMNDPQYQQQVNFNAEKQRLEKAQQEADLKTFRVRPLNSDSKEVGTALQIKAMIDQDLTAFAGSRIRIKLLQEMKVGEVVIPEGSLLYAVVSGFSEQRIKLSVMSVNSGQRILPVKLEVYDLDGWPGLYVPVSAFREFSKNLGGESIQGVSVSSASGQQFLMSTVDRFFQSTASAISGMIRKNKAKIKYSTYVFLVDALVK